MTRRLRRYGAYAFWSAAGFALPIAIDRLVICPLLKRHLGQDVFGAFIWLLAVVNVLGLATGAGFSNFMMREYAARDAAAARQMMRTVLCLTLLVGGTMLTVGGFFSYWAADDIVRAHKWVLYLPLLLFGLVRCVEWMIITILRIRRLFLTIFLLKAVEGVVLLAILLVAPMRNLAIIGIIYVASVVAPLILGIYLSRREIGVGSWLDRPTTGLLMKAWAGLASVALIEQSLVYAPRIVLGILEQSGSVAVLFAGTSIGAVFVMPVGMAGGLVLALLASKTEFRFAGRLGAVYLSLCFVVAAGVALASWFVGPFLIRFLYPEIAPETMQFYHWIPVANGAAAVILLIRPVAIKYARIRTIVLMSTATLSMQALALFILIPRLGAGGAAMAFALATLLAMLLWLGCYAALIRDDRKARGGLRLAGGAGTDTVRQDR